MDSQTIQQCEKCRIFLSTSNLNFCPHKGRLLLYCNKCYLKGCQSCRKQQSFQLQSPTLKNQKKEQEKPDVKICVVCDGYFKSDYLIMDGLTYCLNCIIENQQGGHKYKPSEINWEEPIEQLYWEEPKKIGMEKSVIKKQIKIREELEKQKQKIESSIKCIICLKNKKDCLNSSCYHIVCCYECGLKEAECPICKVAMNPQKVYV